MCQKSIAFFSFEIGLDYRIPNYAGGLGILAGDMLKSAADLNLDMVGVSLLYSQGIFQQQLDEQGKQTEYYSKWEPRDFMELLQETAQVRISGRQIKVQIWKYEVGGAEGNVLPIYFLDTNCPENTPEDRDLCNEVYPSDPTVWLRQQILLGIVGPQALEILGYDMFDNYHLNESHDMFVLFELRRVLGSWEEVAKRAVTTVHTPLPGAHKLLALKTLSEHLDKPYYDLIPEPDQKRGQLNQTEFAIRFSKYANAVALKHEEVTKAAYPERQIKSVTNGVHVRTWMSKNLQELCDKHLSGWQTDPNKLRLAERLPDEGLLKAHQRDKEELLGYVQAETGELLDPDKFTIGFARRAVQYKRANFIFSDFGRLSAMAEKFGGIQIIFSGKAAPADDFGKEIITKLFAYKQQAGNGLKIVYLPNYNMQTGGKMVSGCDLWLNNPMIPWEASGTSGMKANLNGVPNFSVLDGWWIEGWIEGVTGWSIGEESNTKENHDKQLEDVYNKLENRIFPAYKDPRTWAKIMKTCITVNGSYFHTHRVLAEYLIEAYIH